MPRPRPSVRAFALLVPPVLRAAPVRSNLAASVEAGCLPAKVTEARRLSSPAGEDTPSRWSPVDTLARGGRVALAEAAAAPSSAVAWRHGDRS